MPVASGMNSHMLNMQKMADILAEDGHQVSVILNNRVKDHIITKHANIINFYVPENVQDISDLSVDDMNFEGLAFMDFIEKLTKIELEFCDSLINNKNAMRSLADGHFDLMIIDLFSECGNIISSHLNLTLIVYQNFGFYSESDAFFPMLTSFTCHASGIACVRDDMTFMERVGNMLFVIIQNHYIYPAIRAKYINLVQQSGIQLQSPLENFHQDKIVLVYVDYVLDSGT